MRTLLGLGFLVLIAPCPLQNLAAQERTTVGGYGEVHYTNPTGPKTPAVVNLARFVVYLAHSFDDRLAFRSELEVEDAKVEGGKPGGEVGLEQAYLDYRLADWITLRTGLVLAPLGIINETHEPPTFNGVERPGFDHDGIPTTWREIGDAAVGTGTFGAPVALVAADARYDSGPFALRAVVANISVSDAQAINAAYGQSLGSRIAGGYVEGAYNLLRLVAPASSHKLNAFIH